MFEYIKAHVELDGKVYFRGLSGPQNLEDHTDLVSTLRLMWGE